MPREGWWAYVCSLGEEVSSKQFYRKFKAKFSNPDISSLHVTPNWDQPDTRAPPTTTNEGISSELTKYYKWLFRRKDSVSPLPLLNELEKRKLSKATSAKLERDNTDHEIKASPSHVRPEARGRSGLEPLRFPSFENQGGISSFYGRWDI